MAGRAYTQLLGEMTRRVGSQLSSVSHPLLEARSGQRRLVVVVSTDKGLCGPLNANLFREVQRLHTSATQYVTVGRKARQFIPLLVGPEGKEAFLADFELKDQFRFQDAKRVSRFVLKKFSGNEVDRVEVAFSHFVNTLLQTPVVLPLLPVQAQEVPGLSWMGALRSEEGWTGGEYLYEPAAEELLGSLLEFYVDFTFYQVLLDARASEHSARMVAMKNATDNANELVRDLTLEYNKARQAAITKEILEIATAQMALE